MGVALSPGSVVGLAVVVVERLEPGDEADTAPEDLDVLPGGGTLANRIFKPNFVRGTRPRPLCQLFADGRRILAFP